MATQSKSTYNLVRLSPKPKGVKQFESLSNELCLHHSLKWQGLIIILER